MKEGEVKKQMRLMGGGAALEFSLLTASFIRHLLEYPGQTGKWFVYLTDWKMLSLGVDGAIKIYKIKQASNVTLLTEQLVQETEIDPEKTQSGSIVELPNMSPVDEDKRRDLAEEKLKILQEPGWEIPTLNLAITVDLLYWGLDRSGGWPSYILHSLDAIALPVIYAAADTPVLSSPILKNRFVQDHIVPFTELAIYAVFYGLYQGVGGGTDENGDPPYAVLDWHEKPVSTAIYSTVLPVAMPVINAILLKLLEQIQKKIHPGHQIKDYSRQNICIRITNKVKNCVSSVISVCIWSRGSDSSPSLVNVEAPRPWYRKFC